MLTKIDIHDLPARFGEALAAATAVGEVVLTEGGEPKARLVPCAPPRPRVPGLHAGMMDVAADFDAPLPDEFWTGRP